MVEPSWVGLGGLAASILSALAAYLAIRQTMLQRKASLKPQLIINNLEIKDNLLSKNNFTSKPFEKTSIDDLHPTLVNAGSGAALNVTTEWSYPQSQKLSWLINKLQVINQSKSLEYKVIDFRNITAYRVDGGLENVIYPQRGNEQINYILPLNVEKGPKKITIPPLILCILLNETNFRMLINSKLDKRIEGPSLRITYYDVEGKRFEINYITNYIVKEVSFTATTNTYSGTLSFEVIKNNRTSRVLKRIRKSYADYMEEHDYNKTKQL